MLMEQPHWGKDVKERWVQKYQGDAETAFVALLRGSTHICPACGHDNTPTRSHDGRVYACNCDRPNIQAVRLYCELADAVGPSNNLIVNLHQQLGVKSERELLHYLEIGKSADVMDEDGRVEVCEQYLSEVYARRPDLRAKSPLSFICVPLQVGG